jgi:hypothetical protein
MAYGLPVGRVVGHPAPSIRLGDLDLFHYAELESTSPLFSTFYFMYVLPYICTGRTIVPYVLVHTVGDNRTQVGLSNSSGHIVTNSDRYGMTRRWLLHQDGYQTLRVYGCLLGC